MENTKVWSQANDKNHRTKIFLTKKLNNNQIKSKK